MHLPACFLFSVLLSFLVTSPPHLPLLKTWRLIVREEVSGHADFRGRILESYSAVRVSTLYVDDHSVILHLCFAACKVWSLFLKDAVKLMWSCMWTSPELLTRVTLRSVSLSLVSRRTTGKKLFYKPWLQSFGLSLILPHRCLFY